MSEKTLVHVYLPNSFGFGDYLRGSICMAQLAKHFHFNLKLDVSGHPIHHYMKNVEVFHPVKVHQLYHGIEPVSKAAELLNAFQASNETVLYVNSNFFYDVGSLTQEVKDLINSAVEFKPEYYQTADSLPLPSYTILHVRCSDEHAIQMDQLVENVDNLSLRCGTIVLSSCYEVKKELEKKYGFFVLNNKPAHCAFSADVAELESVVTDYIILSRSKSTTCYSFYSHGSGFSEHCSVLHNIPYRLIKEETRLVALVPPVAAPLPPVAPPLPIKSDNVVVTASPPPTNVRSFEKKMPTMMKAPMRRKFNIF
jgi:hypothetical protein